MLNKARNSQFFLSLSGTLLLGLAIAVACALFQYASLFFANSLALPVPFEKKSALTWSADVSSLPDGTYYVSIGRPRGLCDLQFDGQVVDSTKSMIPGLRSQLTLGSALVQQSPTRTNNILIRCEDELGFRTSLSHPPVIASLRPGLLLQGARLFTETVLGPLASIILLIFLGLFSPWKAAVKNERRHHATFLIYAAISLMYSLSLAHLPRLFLDGLSASFLHVIMRIAYSASFVTLCASFGRVKKSLYAFLVLILSGMTFGAIFHPTSFEWLYDRIYIAFPLVTAWLLIDFSTEQAKSQAFVLMRYIIAATFFTQLIDLSIIWLNFGVFSAPIAITLIGFLVALTSARMEARSSSLNHAIDQVMNILQVDLPAHELLEHLARITHGETSFARVSAYVDAFSLGVTDRPHEQLVRVVGRGYTKDTHVDQTIIFAKNRGLKMLEVLKSGQAALRQGEKDRVFFLNIPLGPHACLNLSDDTPRPAYLAYESFEIIKRLQSALFAVGDRIIDFGIKNGMALERLRTIRGDGSWTVDIGAIFVDINDFSRSCERYGEEYSNFIASTYLPALCKVVRKWGVREFSRGDEIYLVVIPELIQDGSSIPRAVINSVSALLQFAYNAGVALCEGAGFSVATLSIGANFGSAVLICDPMQARTSGQMINDACRLREAAPNGSAMLHINLVDYLYEDERVNMGEPTTILVKKNCMVAHRYQYPRRSA